MYLVRELPVSSESAPDTQKDRNLHSPTVDSPVVKLEDSEKALRRVSEPTKRQTTNLQHPGSNETPPQKKKGQKPHLKMNGPEHTRAQTMQLQTPNHLKPEMKNSQVQVPLNTQRPRKGTAPRRLRRKSPSSPGLHSKSSRDPSRALRVLVFRLRLYLRKLRTIPMPPSASNQYKVFMETISPQRILARGLYARRELRSGSLAALGASTRLHQRAWHSTNRGALSD